jgi:SAM-dependent methyltransferase
LTGPPATFDRLAGDYDRLRPADDNWRSVVDLIWEVGDLLGRRVVDVGCGTGRLAGELAQRGARVWAVDPSEEMLAEAGRRLPRLVGLKRGSAEALPFRDGWFERAVLWLVVHHVDRARALPELRRVLRHGGKIVIATFPPGHFRRIWLAPLFPSLEAIDRARFPRPDDLGKELEAHGFGNVQIHGLTLPARVTREEALERIRGRYISTLWLLDEDEYRAGLEKAERELAAETEYSLEWTIVVADRL